MFLIGFVLVQHNVLYFECIGKEDRFYLQNKVIFISKTNSVFFWLRITYKISLFKLIWLRIVFKNFKNIWLKLPGQVDLTYPIFCQAYYTHFAK